MAWLRVKDPRGRTRLQELEGDRAVVGRSASCEISVDDPDVGLRHVSILQTNHGFLIVNETASLAVWDGETRVNNHFMEAGVAYRVGGSTLTLVTDPDEPETPAKAATPDALADASTLLDDRDPNAGTPAGEASPETSEGENNDAFGSGGTMPATANPSASDLPPPPPFPALRPAPRPNPEGSTPTETGTLPPIPDDSGDILLSDETPGGTLHGIDALPSATPTEHLTAVAEGEPVDAAERQTELQTSLSPNAPHPAPPPGAKAQSDSWIWRKADESQSGSGPSVYSMDDGVPVVHASSQSWGWHEGQVPTATLDPAVEIPSGQPTPQVKPTVVRATEPAPAPAPISAPALPRPERAPPHSPPAPQVEPARLEPALPPTGSGPAANPGMRPLPQDPAVETPRRHVQPVGLPQREGERPFPQVSKQLSSGHSWMWALPSSVRDDFDPARVRNATPPLIIAGIVLVLIGGVLIGAGFALGLTPDAVMAAVRGGK